MPALTDYRHTTSDEPDWQSRHAISVYLVTPWAGRPDPDFIEKAGDTRAVAYVTESESWPCWDCGKYHIHQRETRLFVGLSQEAARDAMIARDAEILSRPNWKRYVAPEQKKVLLSTVDFAAKVDWEGGIVGALEYGLLPEDTNDKVLAGLWSELSEAYAHGGGTGFRTLCQRVLAYLDEATET